MYNFMEAFHLTEVLLVLSLLVAFLILGVFGQRKTWISADALMLAGFGAGFALFPGHLLGYQTTGVLKSTEIALSRIYGATALGTSVTWLWTRETRDATVPITIMMSRVFTSSMLLVAQGFAFRAGGTRSKSADTSSDLKWIDQFVIMFMLPTLMWLLGHLFHLCRSHDFSTYPQHNTRLNNNLRLDAWFQLLLGAVLIAFPAQIIKDIMTSPGSNNVALHVARSTGILCVGEAIIALQAPGFLHVRDKRVVFITRIASVLMQLSALGFSAFLGVVSMHTLPWVVGLAVPILINSLIGLCTDGTIFYSVPSAVASPNKNKSH